MTWLETVRLWSCRECGALVASIDQPGGDDEENLRLPNLSHGIPPVRARLEDKLFRRVGELEVSVPNAPQRPA